MIQFDLQEYLKNPNRKIMTRDGRYVRIICTDKNDKIYPIVALVGENSEICCYTEKGKYFGNHSDFPSPNDLFFASIKKTGWVNISRIEGNIGLVTYTGQIYPTKGEAIAGFGGVRGLIDTVPIEWEE